MNPEERRIESMAEPEWGPLQPVLALLAQEDGVAEGVLDRKQSDASLARALGSEELTAAVKAASLEQMDAALAHDALALQYAAASASLLLQVSRFFCQVPVVVAAKEIKKGRLSVLCAQYAELAVDLRQSVKTIFPLKSFLRRFHQQGHTVLTPLHAQFFYLCLQAKCYFAAMEVLDQYVRRPSLSFPPIHSQSHLVTCVDFLGYAYYGGLLYLGEKRYQEALDLFLLAITAPAVSLSAFVIEAYKKLVLVTLIQRGETVLLPKYTPFVVLRHVENHCTAYVDLANAFAVKKDVAAAVEIATKFEHEFAKDGNLGLVKQSVQALKQRKLLQLTRTYATIELAEMTTAAGMASSDAVAAEKMLLALISTGQMAAVLDKQKAMVRFVLEDEEDDEQQDASHGEATRQLQKEMEKLVLVASQLRYMDVELVTSAKFQSRQQKDKDRRSRLSMHNQQGDDHVAFDGASGMDTME
ncbi:hypothetical protein BBJ28_00007484 [Nothophytophthora sp. Chile5]|nr:hypothetical protein BBJ28_00007484 [Nothophytophthora sp. Chile5]